MVHLDMVIERYEALASQPQLVAETEMSERLARLDKDDVRADFDVSSMNETRNKFSVTSKLL